MDYKKAYNVFMIMAFTALLLIAIAILLEFIWFVVIGLILAAVARLLAYMFYRCPHCKKTLSLRFKPPHECPECGKKMD